MRARKCLLRFRRDDGGGVRLGVFEAGAARAHDRRDVIEQLRIRQRQLAEILRGDLQHRHVVHRLDRGGAASPVSIDISPKNPPAGITATSCPDGSSTTRACPSSARTSNRLRRPAARSLRPRRTDDGSAALASAWRASALSVLNRSIDAELIGGRGDVALGPDRLLVALVLDLDRIGNLDVAAAEGVPEIGAHLVARRRDRRA